MPARLINAFDAAAALSLTDLLAGFQSGTVKIEMQALWDFINKLSVKAEVGTTYTYLAADRHRLITHSNAAAIAAGLPQAGTTGFADGWFTVVKNLGAGLLTITPTTSTINGAATLSLRGGESAIIISDGTNYVAILVGRINLVCLAIAASDEATPITAGVGKAKFVNPYPTAFNIVEVVASLSTPQTSGSIFTVDINEGTSPTSILSTKLTIDNGEYTGGSNAAAGSATPAVISDESIAAYGMLSVDVDQIGDGTAAGLKVYLLGYPS